MNDLEKLFLCELQDIYDAEHQLVKALDEMANATECTQLKGAFQGHREQTRNHVTRLEEVFRQIGVKPKRRTCDGIEGIIDEGQTMAKEFAGNQALDAALIAAGQKAEHYEITSYGTLRAWAQELGYGGAVPLLEETLAEETDADAKLTELAVTAKNSKAAAADTDKKSSASAKLAKVASHGT